MPRMSTGEKLSTESYKGVRDFYPEDQFYQRYIFEHMERVCELLGMKNMVPAYSNRQNYIKTKHPTKSSTNKHTRLPIAAIAR